MTAIESAIRRAFPGNDPTMMKARVALLRLLRAAEYAQVYGDNAIDWAALACSDPALALSAGDLPAAANSLGTILITAGQELYRARDAFIELRLEHARFLDLKSIEKGANHGGNDRAEVSQGDASGAPECPF